MALTFDLVNYTPSADLADNGTFVFTTPKNGGLYAQTAEVMSIPALNNILAQAADTFTIAYGASTTHTLTYEDATTIPAGSLITLQLPLATYEDIVALTDSSGGTASNTLAAITGSYVEATIENTVASLAAKINELVAQVNTLKAQMEAQNLLPV
jgi:hypothetical protein